MTAPPGLAHRNHHRAPQGAETGPHPRGPGSHRRDIKETENAPARGTGRRGLQTLRGHISKCLPKTHEVSISPRGTSMGDDVGMYPRMRTQAFVRVRRAGRRFVGDGSRSAT